MFHKPTRKVIPVISACLGIGGIFFALWVWAADRNPHRRLTALTEQGIPITVADLDAQSAHDGMQATELVRALMAELAATDSGWQDLLSSDTVIAGAPTDEELARMRAIAENPHARELFRQLAELPGEEPYAALGTQGDFMERLLGVISDVRGVYRYLCVSAHYHRLQGKPERSMEDVLLSLRTLRRGAPCLVGNLVRVACLRITLREAADTLSAGRFPSETLNALDARLAELDVHRWWEEALRSEGAYGLDQMERQMSFARYWPASVMYYSTVDYYLDVLDYYRQHGLEVPGKTAAPSPQKSFSAWNKLVDLALPAFEAGQNAGRTAVAEIRCLRAHVRIVEQANEKGGKAEIAWESIDLPEGEKVDPFTGTPLLLRPVDDGWLVYSVGTNLRDDGGKFDGQEDVGLRVSLPR